MIIADTGLWVALFDRRDRFHTIACQRLEALEEPLITTVPVITEVCYLLQKKAGQPKATAFLRSQQRGAFVLFHLGETHFPEIVALMDRYKNLPMDFADASLVILAQHLGHGRILSTDQRDFGVYRWKNQHPFTNLLA